LLLTMGNAMIPGVFSLSGWDLVGALPVPEEQVSRHVKGADFRWINRGAIDLMDVNPQAQKSAYGLPRAKALYGPLPAQLKDPDSYASSLKQILTARQKHRIAEGEIVALPKTQNDGSCAILMKLPDESLALTVLNFSRSEVTEMIAELRGKNAIDAVTNQSEGNIDDGKLSVKLPGWGAKTLIVR
jgi:hypothetical protein